MRFMTYNIRHGEGMDGWVSNGRIARVITRAEPDVVGLNEVWNLRGIWDQAQLIAELSEMCHAYVPNHVRWIHALGNAVLTRGRIVGHHNAPLPGGLERRGALVAEIEVDSTPVTFVSTHLSLGKKHRAEQIAHLAETLPDDRPLVLAGDLNCQSRELGPLAERFSVVECPPATFPSVRPNRALDHIVFSRHWRLECIEALPSRASDHLPLLAELKLVSDAG